jgi:hypothetical protein
MPQFTLTQEEHVMVVDALRSKATQYTTMFGVADPALGAMLAKIEGELPTAVEQPADLVEPTEEEIEAHAAAEEPTATDETSVAE